jgi:3-isopropylmalate/(R)-2-methylmalate dehydratase large subunit
VWEAHVVRQGEGEPDLLYIDLHLLHEVTSPQAFDGLRLAGRPCAARTSRWPPRTTTSRRPPGPITDPVSSRTQVDTLRANCAEFGVRDLPDG